jgi:outer membrane protein assembly factor BamC
MKFFPVLLLMSVFALSACSTTSDYKGVYEGAKVTNPLQVPPDLSQPENESGSADAVTSYLGYEKSLNAQGKDQLLQGYDGMHFVRDGSLFWLEIKASPSNVWQSLHNFFNRLGFKIISEQPELGLMQTDWQKNNVNVPSNWFLKTIGKLYTPVIMDSYRAHLEYDETKQVTRVFISHQGMREINSSDDSDARSGNYKWISRPSDPGLEEEMLMRFMEYRGMGEKEAKQVIAQAKPVIKATLTQDKNGYVLQYNDSFPRVWRLVGIALDRIGILVEDRNRSAGVYYMQLPDTFTLNDKSGFFNSTKKPSKDKYLLSLEDKGDNTLITVKPRGDVGKDFAEVSKRILDEIKNNLQ